MTSRDTGAGAGAVAVAPLRAPPSRFGTRTDAFLLGANVFGMLLYLVRASHAWADPRERAAGVDTVAGEPLVWALAVVPVWATFIVINLVWLVVGIRRRRLPVSNWLIVTLGWLAALLIDSTHL